LVFTKLSDYVACSSDKGTVHIFAIKEGIEPSKGFLGMKQERSFAKFRLTGVCPKCVITEDKKLLVITKEGFYYVVDVDWVKGGDCTKIDKKKLLEDEKYAKSKDK